MVSLDKNRHEREQVWRQSGALSTSIVSEEIFFRGEMKWPFLDKMCPCEVSNHEKQTDTHLRARWELSNGIDGLSYWAMVWSHQAKENLGCSFNKAFSLQIHSFASGAVLNVGRREGPKSCGDHSGQTDHWKGDPSVVGKRLNPTFFFKGIKISV